MKYLKHINEFLNNDMIYLKNYFSMSEEEQKKSLPYEYSFLFDEFLDDQVQDFDMDGMESYEIPEYLEQHNKDLFNDFADYLYKQVEDHTLNVSEGDYPAWSFFDNDPKLIKNQWLIHFTNDAESIAEDGFKYGVNDYSKLGLTTTLGEFEKKYGGYNFAYTIADFNRYARADRRNYKYGEEMVLFRASGIKMWHYSDEEPQVIFYGNTATNIIPITKGDDSRYAIRYDYRILYESDELDKVVEWVINNFDQYRKKL